MTVRYLVGDTRTVTATIPDGSVSLVACSPPFIALRSYLPDDHPDKHLEIGSEPDPATFLQTLLELTAEWGRVLAPWGSIAIELGDTYSGSGGGDAALSYRMAINGERDKAGKTKTRASEGWPRAKSLALIPQLYATSLAYGRNLLTGQPSPAGQWLVRNEIVWHRPNPAVGALGDKVRPSTSYICVATRSPKRWYDLDAVRTVGTEPGKVKTHAKNLAGANPSTGWVSDNTEIHQNPAGAPPLDCWFDPYDPPECPVGGKHVFNLEAECLACTWQPPADQHDVWTLTTQPSKLAHYAMWPAKLAERLILMMCPAEVCTTCGEPRRRITGKAEYVPSATYRGGSMLADSERVGGDGVNQWAGAAGAKASVIRTAPTLGWSDCGHGTYTPGTVLDPFAGTGTTLAVADHHGRDAIGIDIDERNRDLYQARRLEVARALNPSAPTELPGQANLFGEMVG